MIIRLQLSSLRENINFENIEFVEKSKFFIQFICSQGINLFIPGKPIISTFSEEIRAQMATSTENFQIYKTILLNQSTTPFHLADLS
jgi:hypothetical protein